MFLYLLNSAIPSIQKVKLNDNDDRGISEILANLGLRESETSYMFSEQDLTLENHDLTDEV